MESVVIILASPQEQHSLYSPNWGASCFASGNVQTAGFRAPEAVVAMCYPKGPCTFAMDVWSLGSIAVWLLTSVRIPSVSEDRLDQLRVYAQLLGPCPRDVPWVSSSLFDILAAVVCDPTACALLVGQGV